MQQNIAEIFDNQIQIIKKIGSGTFGEIFEGFDKKMNKTIALKLESIKTKHPVVFYEGKLLQYLNQDEQASNKGIPKGHKCKTEDQYNILVMDLLGPSLTQLFNQCGGKFSLKTVLMIGIQILDIIQFIHSKGFIYRNICMNHFLIGGIQNENKLYIIDFSLAKRYVDKEGNHIKYQEGRSLRTKQRYASINNHLGVEATRRDDLESIGYLLVYLLKGSLPWAPSKVRKNKEYRESTHKTKLLASLEQICKDCPGEFLIYLNQVRNLKFEEVPNYDYLRSLMENLFAKSNFEMDYCYDWNINANLDNRIIQ